MERIFRVPEIFDGERLDKVLKELLPELSRRRLRTALGDGSVYLNGRRCLKLSKPVMKGGEIKIVMADNREETVDGLVPLAVIFEEHGLIAVDKPPLFPSTPTQASLRSAQQAVAEMKGVKLSEIHPVNRLDLPVSGVLLFACGQDAASKIEEIKNRSLIGKVYLAWVSGIPAQGDGRIDTPLSAEKGTAYADPSGKVSTTFFRVLKTVGNFSLLEVNPVTGRMHQIRVHLKIAGFPIVGDRKYGRAPFPSRRPLLHCMKISFPSLVEGAGTVTIAAAPPSDFEEFSIFASNSNSSSVEGGRP